MPQIEIEEIAGRLATISQAELDALPFGVIRIDEAGDVMMVNDYEMTTAGFKPDRVIGRNFFSEIAPCANVQAFLEPFERAVAGNHLNVRFDFLFNLPDHLRKVTIHMLCNQESEGIWILISPLEA